jgi:hypothetical protein
MIRKPNYDWVPSDEHFPDYFWPEEISQRYGWTRQACHVTAKRKKWGKLVSGRNVLYKAADVIQFDRERRLKVLSIKLADIVNADIEIKKQKIRAEKGVVRVRGIPPVKGLTRAKLKKAREVHCPHPECDAFAYRSNDKGGITLCENGHLTEFVQGEELLEK